jgi:uncharacterized membrane protein YbhN (UPF0104 family)
MRQQSAGLLQAAGLVVLERYCGFLATFVMALIALVASDFGARHPDLGSSVLLVFLVFLAPLTLVADRRAAKAAGRLRQLGLTRIAAALVSSAAEARFFISKPRLWTSVLALSAAMKLCVAIMLVLLAAGLGLRLGWAEVMVFLPLHTVVSALPVTLNGLGAREANLVIFFTQLGLSDEQATSLAFLHLIWIYATALPGGIFLLRGGAPRRGPDREQRAR